MLSATTKMEMRVQFSNRMHDLIGPDFYQNDADWLRLVRDFMAGKLVIARRIIVNGKHVGWEIES